MQCIPEDAEGHPDLEILDAQLQRHSAARLLLAVFPAASAATGALTDVATLCQALHRRGALVAIDYATPRAPAAAIAAAGCFRGAGSVEPDAAIVAAGALTGAPEAAYALVSCQAKIADGSMMGPPMPSGAKPPSIPSCMHVWHAYVFPCPRQWHISKPHTLNGHSSAVMILHCFWER
jgi:hypothetical protein